jgi:elongation factor 3
MQRFNYIAHMHCAVQELVSRGFGKMIAEYDGKLASAAGDKKALTRANVEQYLADFGVNSELACHSHIKGLSGGQKVKLVLAAAMWSHPHYLIMDEPTNYLDRARFTHSRFARSHPLCCARGRAAG